MRDRIIAVYEKDGGFIDRYLVVFDERNGDYYVGLSIYIIFQTEESNRQFFSKKSASYY